MPGKKALIVISNGKSTKENGYLARVQEQLRFANVEYVVFDEVEPNPLKSTVMHGAGLIMISKAYYSFFINKHVCDDRFIRMAQAMGIKGTSKPIDFMEFIMG